jgi:co-chaperonin GroES (HSP10)
MADVEPILNYCIIDLEPVPELLIEERYPLVNRIGRITAVGPGRLSRKGVLLPPDVEVGDRVIVGRVAGIEVEVDDKELRVIRDGEALCVLEDDDGAT